MADGTTSAIIAASATLVTAFLTQFVAEAYKRYKDGSALAAGIAGELAAYEGAAAQLVPIFRSWINASAQGVLDTSGFRSIEKPTDVFFDEVVGKIGVLGRNFTEDIVFVYSHLRAFRSTFALIILSHKEMSPIEIQARCSACVHAIIQADERAQTLLPKLHARADTPFLLGWRRPPTRNQATR